MHSLSAHGDYQEMLKFLSCQETDKVKTIFLVHGDPEAKQGWKEHLLAAGYANVIIPAKGDVIQL